MSYQLLGTLRRKSRIKTKQGNEALKLTVEHEVPRGDGSTDLLLEDLFTDVSDDPRCVVGDHIAFDVRIYPKGRNLGHSVNKVINVAPADYGDYNRTQPASSEADE